MLVEEAGPDAIEKAALEITFHQLGREPGEVGVHEQAVGLLAAEGAAEVHDGI